VSLNQLIVDQPQPEIAGSAVILGEVHVGAGAVLAQGLVVRAHDGAVSIGNYSAILENGVVIGTRRHPVQVGQRTVFGHRGTVVHRPTRAGERMGTLYAYRGKIPSIGAGTVLFDSAEITGDVVIGDDTLIGAGVKIIGDSHGPVRVGSRVQILENTVLHLLPDNELIIGDDVVIGPGAMIHGCHIGRGSIVEPGAIVCDGSVVGAESVVRAGACVKQRDRFGDRSVLDGFPARLTGTLAAPPPVPGWALPPDAVATLRRVPR
jgi:carbonic anhydrase/acetyltransferase-like protein (isoleucine patch superfamily)